MRIAIDDVIWQLQKDRPRGIARVWSNLIPFMKEMLKPKHELVLLSRETANHQDFKLETHNLPNYKGGSERIKSIQITDDICEKLNIDLFISTYYSRAETIKNLVMIHDLIPERRKFLTTRPQFGERADCYARAASLICVSESTKKDLYQWYGDKIKNKNVHVVLEGVSSSFNPASSEKINQFKIKHGIKTNYLIVDGEPTQEMISSFCKAIALFPRLAIVTYGGMPQNLIAISCAEYNIPFHSIYWLKDAEVIEALSGAKGLIFLSECEGFGLPVLEAMSCGTPVLCSRNTSLPEVGGDAVHYLTNYKENYVKEQVLNFLKEENLTYQKDKGLQRSKLFSWEKMASGIVKIIKDEI